MFRTAGLIVALVVTSASLVEVRPAGADARLSLSLHGRDPEAVDPAALHRASYTRYSAIPYTDGVNMPASFTHLANDNCSSSYYTYMWSLVIAKDLFYRVRSFESPRPGSGDAADLVTDLLGRPFNADAWEAWLKTGTRQTVWA